MQEQSFHPLDYLSVLHRRRWWLVVPLTLCIIGGLLAAIFAPRVYRSHATVAVSSPKVSSALVGTAAALPREERVRAVAQQLLSRRVLERVVHEERLAPPDEVDRVVDEMLLPDRIKVEPLSLLRNVGGDKPQLEAFLLSYSADDPALAQRVTNRLASVFVEVTSRTREARAEDTSAFIAAQLAQSKERLNALEAKLRDAKEAYMGSLPEQTQANLAMAAGIRQQLESNAMALRGEQDRLTMIERQIESMRRGAEDVLLPGGMAAGHARVVQLQKELADARSRYTEKHPEIQRLREELAQAKREAESAMRQPEEERLSALKFDPTYRQLLADRETARMRIRELQRAEARARAQLAVYEARVEAAPKVEQQLAAVQREYDLERQQYAELSKKLHAAQLAESLEQRQGGEQFQ
ncbi:MAG TPA: Wzz/FepE/Etk N-terminal domain-containing protein, partial [Vicinamibacterales bacterium]|nr:Wzz/FepE/Etk N-terminal domain-containing protein [Vicinamibacterales bacterium]